MPTVLSFNLGKRRSCQIIQFLNVLTLNVPNITFTIPGRCVIVVIVVHVVSVLVSLHPTPMECGKCLVYNVSSTSIVVKKNFKRPKCTLYTTALWGGWGVIARGQERHERH